MHVDDVGHAVPILFPQVFAEHFAGDQLSGVANQKFQQAEFGGRQINLGPAANHASNENDPTVRPRIELAGQMGVEPRMANRAAEYYRKAIDAGIGPKYFPAIIELVEGKA